MKQVLVCLKKNNGIIRMGVLDPWRKQLVGLGNAIRNGDTASIPKHVKETLDAGATREDIQKVVEFIIGDEDLLRSLLILKEALDFEDNIRREYISFVDDCQED